MKKWSTLAILPAAAMLLGTSAFAADTDFTMSFCTWT